MLKDTITEKEFSEITKRYNSNSEFLKYFEDYKFKKIPYKSEENLDLYFLMKTNILYLFSFGEKQPGRYMLFPEGVCEFNNKY